MLVPTITTLRTEDFPDQQSWIGKLIFPINTFLTNATIALNGNMTFGDNIPTQTYTMAFTYNAASDFPKSFAWSLPSTSTSKTSSVPVEIRICSATENGSAVCLAPPPWSYASGIITIPFFVKLTTSGVSSLTAGATYKIILRGNP